MWYLIIGLIAGLVTGFIISRIVNQNKNEPKKSSLIEKKEKKKEKNLNKLKEYLKGKEFVANNEIENLLGISDATSERYLDQLEKEGLLVQVGKTGVSTKYRVNVQ